MRIRLELVHKHAKVKQVVLKADTIIGRSTECGLRIASNEVSRQHCKIGISKDGVTVRDLGSSNGTFINDYQLEPETDYEIAPDSELAIGGIKFLVRFEEPAGREMQGNGLGSTVDLKPALQEAQENAAVDPIQPTDESEEETVKFASANEATALETPSPAASRETVPMTRPRDLDSATNDSEVALSARGDSAVLERQDAASEPVFPTSETQSDLDPDSSLDAFFRKFE